MPLLSDGSRSDERRNSALDLALREVVPGQALAELPEIGRAHV